VRLAEFILTEKEQILANWEAFARRQVPAAESMGSLALRDHAEQILGAIAKDLKTYQSRDAQTQKSLGLAPVVLDAPETAAQTHALLRAQSGFDIRQLAAEYRALRASVLRLWTDAHSSVPDMFEQAMRFNEAIDQALAESIGHFHERMEQGRNLLLGMLGHDLRSPLQSIQTTAAYLTALNAGTEVSEAAARLINSGSRMKALLDDLLDFNRTKLGVGIRVRPAEIESAAVLTDELNLLRAAHPSRRIELTIAGDTRGVWDGMRLRQVLNNLVVNALKYGAPATAVQILVRGEDSQLRLEVANRGPAIPSVALESIFDPLRRQVSGEDAADGLGLGLYIAREIVKAHRGEIHAQSDGERTVFTVLLPRR
jgi:signal transduction histidine kinase